MITKISKFNKQIAILCAILTCNFSLQQLYATDFISQNNNNKLIVTKTISLNTPTNLNNQFIGMDSILDESQEEVLVMKASLSVVAGGDALKQAASVYTAVTSPAAGHTIGVDPQAKTLSVSFQEVSLNANGQIDISGGATKILGVYLYSSNVYCTSRLGKVIPSVTIIPGGTVISGTTAFPSGSTDSGAGTAIMSQSIHHGMSFVSVVEGQSYLNLGINSMTYSDSHVSGWKWN